MATLTWTDYGELRSMAYRKGYGKEELKALSDPWDKSDLLAMFQGCEDWFTSGFNGIPTTSLKTALETGLGQSMTNPLAQKVSAVWFFWKYNKLFGG